MVKAFSRAVDGSLFSGNLECPPELRRSPTSGSVLMGKLSRMPLMGNPPVKLKRILGIVVMVWMAMAYSPFLYAANPAFSGDPCSSTKGSFAFRYAFRLTEDEVARLERFQVVVTANILPPGQIRRLRNARTKLFFYHWLTGFYHDRGPSKTDRGFSWESFELGAHPEWLLNPERPAAGPDGRGRAFYYDPNHAGLRNARARKLGQALLHSAYDGVFFDLVGSPHVPADLQKVYFARHPDGSYDEDLSGFIKALKKSSPGSLIFTNQGYRKPSFYLPRADYDLSESLMTSYAWGEPIGGYIEGKGIVRGRETFYRAWAELKALVDGIAAHVKQYNPRVKIYHLNYVNPIYRPTGRIAIIEGAKYPVFREELDRPAIYYGYAASKLWGHESYSPVTDGMDFGHDDIYFADLGQPLGESYEERDGLVRRYYENGLVALNPALALRTADIRSGFIPARVKGLWDCYEGKPIRGFRVTLEPTVSSASGRAYPAGRVYLYRE
jgi:hypothetical protein